MRNFSKKIITSVLTLVLTVVALGTGVFAWFSINTKTSATGLNGQAEAATGGFYISHDGSTWVNTLSLSDPLILPHNGFKGGANDRFTDLTSTDGISFYKIDYEDNDNKFDGDPVSAGYIEFPLYFLTDLSSINLYLITLQITSDTTTWKAEKGATAGTRTVNLGDDMSAQLAHALRISFEEVDWLDDQTTVYADNDNLVNYKNIYENPSSADAGLVFGNTVGFGNTVADNFAAAYYNAIHPSALQTFTTGVVGRGDKVLDNTNNKILETLEIHEDYIAGIRGTLDDVFTNGGKVMVRIWLEGWDQEAFNALFGGTATINMTFEVRDQ